MIDKKTEADIKAIKSFLELWRKFHSIYNEAVSKEVISKEGEATFLETRDMIKLKYGELKNTLEIRYAPHSRLTDPADDILALSGIRLMSEKSLKKLNEDWRDSYVFLNSIMERLKNRKRRLEEFNPISVLFKRFFEREASVEHKRRF